MQKIKSMSDILFIILIVLVIILNVVIQDKLLESITFLLVTLSFTASRFALSRNRKDERLHKINMTSGYMSFALAIFLLMLTLALLHTTDFTMDLGDAVIYLSMFMMLTFSVCYAFLKRKL